MSEDLKEVKRAMLFIYRMSVPGRENSKTKVLRSKCVVCREAIRPVAGVK